MHVSYYDFTSLDLKYATESLIVGCIDNDGDGYGNPGNALCPKGSATDCDDTDRDRNPDTIWYWDSDGDGFGNQSVVHPTGPQCEQPAGASDYVPNYYDYNVSDPLIGAPVKEDGVETFYYLTLQEAYNLASDGNTIKAAAVPFDEYLYININKTVTFEGGYDWNFIDNTGGNSTLEGDMEISDGTNTIENFIIDIP